MFKELAPVLRHRAVLMTITSTEEDQIRVNIVPKKLKDDENRALTTPSHSHRNGRGTRLRTRPDAGRLRRLPSSAEEHACPGQGRYGCGREYESKPKLAPKTKTPLNKETTGTTGPTDTTSAKPSQKPAKSAEPVQPPRPKTASLFDMPAYPSQEAVIQPERRDEEDILA